MLACRAFCVQKGESSDLVFEPVGIMTTNFEKFCESGVEMDLSESESSALDLFVVRRCLL